jgi:hypothetical protein
MVVLDPSRLPPHIADEASIGARRIVVALRIPLDKVCIIVALAREGLSAPSPDGEEPPPGAPQSDTDEGALPPVEDYDEAGAFDPLFDYVDALNGDELADLLALVWLGRGDYAGEEWAEAQAAADDETGDGDAVAEIIQDPQLPDDVAAGLEALGYECPEV